METQAKVYHRSEYHALLLCNNGWDNQGTIASLMYYYAKIIKGWDNQGSDKWGHTYVPTYIANQAAYTYIRT